MDEPPSPPTEPPERIITAEAQKRWFDLPPNEPLQIALTRDQLDNLFLGIRECIIGQSDLTGVVIALSNGNMELAQKNLEASQVHQRAALEYLDNLIVHAMLTAKPV